MKRLIVALFIVSGVFLFSCKSVVNNSDDERFTVVDSLLGREVVNENLGIKFSTPVNWNPDNSNLAAIQQQFTSLASFKNLKVLDIYIDKTNMAMMIISDISGIQDSVIKNILSNSQLNFADTTGSTQVSTDKYEYNSFEVHQVLIKNPQFVNNKLFYLDGAKKPFEVDFFTTAGTYSKVEKAIESSLATFKED